MSRAFSLDLDRCGISGGRRVCIGGRGSLPGVARSRSTTPDEPAHPVSYASTLALAKAPWPPCIPAFRILTKGDRPRLMAHPPSGFPLAMPFQTGRVRRLLHNANNDVAK